MANTKQNTEFAKPFNDLTKYVPQFLRNEMNISLIDNLFNRFMTHDESVPLYGYAGRRPASGDDKTPRIPQLNIEREVNALTPVISFKTGLTDNLFTVQDLIKKAKTLGVSNAGESWFYSQSNNFVPPVSLDKFVNFFNYFWVGNILDTKPQLAWNPGLDPEYYVIAQPVPSDIIKMNVRVATTTNIVRTGSGFGKIGFTVKFSSPTQFKITPNGSLGVWNPVYSGNLTLTEMDQTFVYQVTNGNETKTLITFNITRDAIYDQDGNPAGFASFEAGDAFEIECKFLTRVYRVAFTGSVGVKGKITKFQSLNEYQTIDGVQLQPGDRVLVKNATNAETGIYVVSADEWASAPDFTGSTKAPGARVWVRGGAVNGSSMFESFSVSGGFGWKLDTSATRSNTNHWQEGNFWVSSEELAKSGVNRNDAIQATRPIIEYHGNLQLNEYVDATTGLPSDAGKFFQQTKTTFDQLPLFDLYRYDGTHSGLASSVFYYEEHVTNSLDTALQKRVDKANNESRDFVFNHGMFDEVTGQLLFVKQNGKIASIWHAGYTAPTIVDVRFNGEDSSVGAKINGLKVVNNQTLQQVWSVFMTSPAEFTVAGSKNTDTVTGNVGALFDNGEISFTVTGTFTGGEQYKIRIGNLEHPAYVRLNANDDIVPMNGGEVGDINGEGAFQISRAFIHNPYLDSRAPINEGVLNSHFRSILDEQVPGAPIDYSFGGDIKLWGEQHTLMAALLMQREMTPVSIIDLSEQMYASALTSVRDIFEQNIALFISGMGSIKDLAAIDTLVDQVLAIHAKSEAAKSVLFDTTSPVVGFPATLPQLACAELVKPTIEFNAEMGIQVIVHHDGHMSELAIDTDEFRRHVLGNFTNTTITRPDGSITSAIGSFTSTPPANPYRGELWRIPSGEIFSFGVDSDDTRAPSTPVLGMLWYNRGTRILFKFNGSDWAVIPTSDAWKSVNLANILNLMILNIETRLFNGINPNARKVDFAALEADPGFVGQLRDELYTFSALNGYDPTGPNYVPADAFTWNYSKAAISNLAPINTPKVPARWFDLLQAHQRTVVGVIPTAQPNNEPWKLFGVADSAIWWSGLTDAKRDAYTPAFQMSQLPNMTNAGVKVDAVSTTRRAHPMSGLITIDNVALAVGDVLLVQNDIAPMNNGLWTISASGWTRHVSSMTAGTYVKILKGNVYHDTFWGLTNDAVGGVTAFNFGQCRTWSNVMWADVKAKYPQLKLSVNTITDELLPPYVNAQSDGAVNAITNVMPSGTALPYEYGQNSPIENIWTHTSNYLYSRVRALFRHDPLMFLGLCWGFNWVDVNSILYDGYDVSMPGHKRFRLHGENIPLIADGRKIALTGTAPAEPIILTYNAYDRDRRQNFMVKTLSGATLGYVQEGIASTINGLKIDIQDRGIAFRMGDRFEIDTAGVAKFIPSATYKFYGYGQIFTDALRSSSIDTNSSYAVAAYREWDVRMGYRAGGLVSTDDLQVLTESMTLSPTAFELLFKKNPIAADSWAQSFRISVSRFGASVINGDTGVHVPANDGSDWQFRIEGYNPRYTKVNVFPFDLTKELITFESLSGESTKLEWTRPTIHAGKPVEVQLPINITGIQNVANFLFGYLDASEAEGWIFNEAGQNLIDAGTGRTRTMQLEIEKFINDCYVGMKADQGSIVNPFIDKAWFGQPAGLVAPFTDVALFDVLGNPGAFDMLGVKYTTKDMNIIRRNDETLIAANGPLFSVHVQVDEYEHLFVFNYFAQPSDKSGLLYDAFSGSRVMTYRFNGRKQQTKTLRPEFGGHYLVGNEVRQGLQASTDSIQNYYNANTAFENETTSRHSLALLGFAEKDYFKDLDISSKTQFNFWRGMIQAKGTNMSIDAYLNNDRFDDAKIDEYWAYKVAEYGDARPRFYPELKLNVDDALTQFTQLWFDPASSDLSNVPADMKSFTQITRFDEDRWFSIDDLNHDTYFEAMQVGSYANKVKSGDIIKLPFIADRLVAGVGADFDIINATTIRAKKTMNNFVVTGFGAATPKFNPVKLFNYVANELIAEIPFWHPAAGAHSPQAMGSVNIISSHNPAKFNTSTLIANSNTFDPLRPWGKNEVGRTWLDTTNLHYVPYYDRHIFKTLGERLSRWGTLADFGSVDVYEWVESGVPPQEYNALARAQAGDANLNPLTKAAGEVGFPLYYVRDREWTMRPIAWSYSPVPVDVDFGDSPPFHGASTKSGLRLNEGGLAILDNQTFKSLKIAGGMHIGAWDISNPDIGPKPVNEYLIEDRFTKFICDSTGVFTDCGKLKGTNQGLSTDICVMSNDANYNPDVVGQLLVQTPAVVVTATATDTSGMIISRNVDVLLKITNVATGISESVTISSVVGTTNTGPVYGAKIEVAPNQMWTFEFVRLGLTITAKATTSGSFPVDALSKAISGATGSSVWTRDAGVVSPIIAANTSSSYLSNDPDVAALTGSYGWRAWSVPTQADLDNDGQQPVSSWKPYQGDLVKVPNFSNAQLQEAMEYTENPLTLNNGAVMHRYVSQWDDWTQLVDDTREITQIGVGGPVEFTYEENVPVNRTGVFLNGAQLLVSGYTIIGKKITVNFVPPGHTATVVIRKYLPTTEELAFEPDDVGQDLKRHQQFKLDFEYVSQPVRGQNGSIDSYLYYFWVRNKTTAASGKKMSIQAVTQDITVGPNNYLTFQHFLDAAGDLPYRYDALTISGLSYMVTKDDTFKLRFTRDFTLRDDPQELDLKNVHTEWTLIRPSQRTRIPESLWSKLTDSVVGKDLGGNMIPSVRRVLYDERHSTRTQFGFEDEQTLAPADLLKASITHSIINTKLVDASGKAPLDIPGLDYDREDLWFIDFEAARKTMTDIWNNGTPAQVNEVFFGALDDILASNYELTDLFKTSRLSAYSIKVVKPASTKLTTHDQNSFNKTEHLP